MRRSRLYLTPSRFSDPDLHPLSQGLPHGSDHVSTLLQAFKTLTKRFIAPAGDVSFLMSTPLTTTQYYPVLRSGFVPPGRQAFHLLHVCPSMGWSGLSLTRRISERCSSRAQSPICDTAAMAATPSPNSKSTM